MVSRRRLFALSSAMAATLLVGRPARAAAVEADLVVYGATSGGICAAVEASNLGASVVIVGGWRERHPGGMMAGGLGYTDIQNKAAFGGLARKVVSLINDAAGVPDDRYSFEPRFAELVFAELLNHHGIGLYWSDGIAAVRRDGTRIEAIRTVDGAEYRGRVFVDASYEGDLMARAGVSYTVGREAADPANQLNGYRGTTRQGRGDNHNFFAPRPSWHRYLGENLLVDPFVEPGRIGSGLLPGINAPDRRPGAADRAVQAYNFRMTMTRDPARLAPITAPDYDPRDYELLFRTVEALAARGAFADPERGCRRWLMLHNDLGNGLFDMNNRGPVSLDLIGGSWRYPEAGYAEREQIRQAHRRWIQGFFHALQHDPDPRVPDGLREWMRGYGLANDHYLSPVRDDPAHWPYELYVREARRMVSATVFDGSDVARAGRPMPATVSIGSYARDSHHVQRIVARNDEWPWLDQRPMVWNEGNFEVAGSDAAQMFTVPYDIVVPRREECTNLFVPFCVSATHEAFGAIRMEMTFMQTGQSVGAAAAMVAHAQVAAQDLPYGDLHQALMRPDYGTPPVLPERIR